MLLNTGETISWIPNCTNYAFRIDLKIFEIILEKTKLFITTEGLQLITPPLTAKLRFEKLIREELTFGEINTPKFSRLRRAKKHCLYTILHCKTRFFFACGGPKFSGQKSKFAIFGEINFLKINRGGINLNFAVNGGVINCNPTVLKT